MHVQEQITGIQTNKKTKFKLSLEGFDSACRSSNSAPRDAEFLPNFKASSPLFKMAAGASQNGPERHMKGSYIGG
jgi:hypothetical protein